MRRKFNATGYVFDFIFVNTSQAAEWNEHGPATPEWVLEKLGQDVFNKLSPDRSDVITVIFVGNDAASWYMSTPWILAHRIGHAINRAVLGTSVLGNQWKEFHKTIFLGMRDIMANLYGMDVSSDRRPNNYHSYGRNREDDLRNSFRVQPRSFPKLDVARSDTGKHFLQVLATHMGSFRSARENNLRAYFEFENELLAQFLTTGKVRFRPPPMTLKGGPSNNRWWFSGHRNYTPDQFRTYAEDYAESLATDCEAQLHNVLEAAKGSILVM